MARILVAGGSLGGLMAANLLLRDGHDVTVLERSPRPLQGRGAGIVTHAGLLDALRAAGVSVDASLGVPVAERVVLAPDGSALCRWDYAQVLTSWSRLYALLRAALPAERYRFDAAVEGAQAQGEGVAVRLAGGQTLTADLLVAADGIRSTLRAQGLPAVQPLYAGYVAWRGLCDEAALSRRTRDSLFPHFGFGLPAGEQMIGYPVAGADDSTVVGQRRWNFVWYRPAPAGPALDTLLTDADGHAYQGHIPPLQVSWRHVAAARQAARERLAPQFAEIVEKSTMPFLQPIFDLESPQLVLPGLGGRAALLGDAAFVARPHVGMGVSKAGDDAMALAACIRQHGATPAALTHYEAQRRPPGAAVVQRARALGAYIQAHAQGASAAREARDVMQQTAIDPALFDTYSPTELAA